MYLDVSSICFNCTAPHDSDICFVPIKVNRHLHTYQCHQGVSFTSHLLSSLFMVSSLINDNGKLKSLM